jgi:hypothetical protein
MEQRWIRAWLLAVSLLAVGMAPGFAAGKTPVDVTQDSLKRYWVVSQEDMSPVMPPLVGSTFAVIASHGRIVMDYEVTINAKGVPTDFRLKSITPKDVDPKPFIAMVMFYRYRPTPENIARVPVRLHGPLPFFMPRE